MNDGAPTTALPAGGAARPRLLYATPTGGTPRPGYIAQLSAIRMSLMSSKYLEHGPKDFMFTMGPVQMARSAIVDSAIKSGYDYILMHDDDLVVDWEGGGLGNPADVLFEQFRKDPKVGVAGAVYLRENPTVPTLTAWHPEHTSTAEDHPGEHMTVACGLPWEPFDVAGIGTGFILISVACCKAVMDRTGREAFLFWPYRSVLGSTATLGEDYYFCWRAQQCGYRVVADARLPTVHLKNSGPLKYVWSDWEAPGKRHDVNLNVPRAAVCTLPNGLQCIDVSESRRGDQEKANEHRSDSPGERHFSGRPGGVNGHHGVAQQL